MKRMLAFVAALALLLPVAPGSALADGCQFTLGFKDLHDAIPSIVGDCIDNQAFAPNGDAQQHTTKGLMAWRKADNWTAFTDGYRTWIRIPTGIANRLNTERLPGEAQQPDPQAPAPAPASPAPSASSQPSASPTPYGPISTSGASPDNTGPPFAPAGTGFTITIDDALGYQPALMTIHPRDCVTWVNVRGFNVHTITSDNGTNPPFNSGGLGMNQSWGTCFAQPGKYGYHSDTDAYQGIDGLTQMPTTIYPLHGIITVQAPS
ncbi:MAG: hypothetical protein JOZ39_12305 [Chloroflexi bacterium]|nr:hypothetical protein [Chloroflexota bacterium]